MATSLKEDVFLFSGLKTHAQLYEASRQLLTEQGTIKPFYQFSKDVEGISRAYNQTYLEAEYQFAVTSAQMAGKWADIQSGDVLQYRTAKDERVRESHRALDEITLPENDPFWLSYYPPNGWRCRCNAVQVRSGKYPLSNSGEAIAKGEAATTQEGKDGKNKLEIFRFNPGKQKVVFPPNHPYNKVAGASEVKKVIKDTSKLDSKVYRYTEWTEEKVKDSFFYKAGIELAPNIRPAETLAINRYTGNYYVEMNQYLRNGGKPPKTMLEALIKVTSSGLDKLPSYKGKCYRGTGLSKEQQDKYEAAFKNKEPYPEIAFTSTSTDPTKKFDGNTTFFIQSKTGKSVKPLSQFSSEEEILFNPNTEFNVISFIRDEKTNNVEIVMEEI